MSEKLRVLDIFSGIGGFSLGLERTGGFETVAFCEIEEFPRRVLAKHWPNVPCYSDVRTLSATRLAVDGIAVDVICGGFPCQDVSIAGKGAGINGGRTGLWREAVRLASETGAFLILENVPKIRSRGLDVLLFALNEIGYDAWWDCVPAAHVGAPHRRDRLWLFAHGQGDAFCAYPDILRSYQAQMHLDRGAELQHEQVGDVRSLAWWRTEPRLERVVDGVPSRMDIARLKAIGNAVVPMIPQMIGEAILSARRAAA